MAWTDAQYLNQLNTIIEVELDRYQYLYARYFNDISIDVRNFWEYEPYLTGYGFDLRQDADLQSPAYVNVIKSVIDTIVSKMANQKVRPYFNSVSGTYSVKQGMRKAQKFFDAWMDKEDIHEKITTAYRNACISNRGVLYIDPVDYHVEVLPPWQIAMLNTEKGYGKPKAMLIKQYRYPTSLLKKAGDGIDYVTRKVLISLETHTVKEYLDDELVSTNEYKADILPVVIMYYNRPVFGNRAPGLVEELDGIQTQLDLINAKLAAASELSPANTTYVIEGSNLKPGDISNRVGLVYGVKMPPGVNTPPVVNVTPAAFDPSWQSEREYLVKTAYEIVGVSQLSAQSKKPSGLESGAALQTMADIESDRFEVQLNHFIATFIDLVRTYIEVVPDDQKVLEGYGVTKWKEIKRDSGNYDVQYSAASALSKEPSEKLKQVLQLSQQGLITPDMVSQYLDTPDLEGVYRGAQAAANACDRKIEAAVDSEDYDIPDYIDYQTLAKKIAVEENALYASLTNDKKGNEEILVSIDRIKKLEEALMQAMEENGFIQADTTGMEAAEDGSMAGLSGTATEANQPANILDKMIGGNAAEQGGAEGSNTAETGNILAANPGEAQMVGE